MSTHRHIDKICGAVLAVTLLLTALLTGAGSSGTRTASVTMGYEKRLFDSSSVHTIDIVMDDWDAFTADCRDEEYRACSVLIDNEACKNVAIRAKGNTSLTQVEAYGNRRYSFKIEFDHYDSSNTYYGLDKLCLNNIIQDNTYMKDYLCYQMMAQMGVASPLCSYAYLTVNGEDWGLYLAVEGVEEAFLKRNYGKNYGELYKPDSQSMGGGAFDMAQAKGSDDVLLKYTDDEPDSYANIFGSARTDCSEGDKTRLIAALKKLNGGGDLSDTVDTGSVIRYFVVHNFVLNFDSYTGPMVHNYYLYEKDGQLQMIPWDYNLAFGGFESAKGATALVNYPIDSPVSGGSIEDRPMLAWIFADEAYTELYHRYFEEFLSVYFDGGYFEELMKRVSSMIAPYVEKDPTRFCTYEEFEAGVSALQEFCLLRAKSVAGQLNGTIGSESGTQSSDTLIDAGSLQIADMGSMNRAADGGMAPPDNTMDDSMVWPAGNMDPPDAANGIADAGNMAPPADPPDPADGSTAPPDSADDGADTGDTATPADPPDPADGGMAPPDNTMDDSMAWPAGNMDPPDAADGSMAPPDPADGGMAPPDPADGGMAPPDPADGGASPQMPPGGADGVREDNTSAWILSGASAAVLVFGLLFAFFFGRRRKI